MPFAPVGTVLPERHADRRSARCAAWSRTACCARVPSSGWAATTRACWCSTSSTGAEPGRPILEALGITPDTVLDVTVEGNRPDAWCVEGIARDLAARLGRPFAPVDGRAARPHGGRAASSSSPSRSQDPDLCGRFTGDGASTRRDGRAVARVARAPPRARGMRPINNVVDASNYVMLELGQPTHPYDLDRLGGARLRRAPRARRRRAARAPRRHRRSSSPGSSGALGRHRRGPRHLRRRRTSPIGLAGVMGGASTRDRDATTSVVLEAAWFDAMAVARSAKRHRLRTEASVRFERGCDPMAATAPRRGFVELLAESSPGCSVAAGHRRRARRAAASPPVLDVDAASPRADASASSSDSTRSRACSRPIGLRRRDERRPRSR